MAGPTIKGINSIANDLTTNDAEKALSAAQGVVIKGLTDDLDTKVEAWVPQGYIYGLELEYATGTTITVKAGTAKDDSNTDTITLASDITKSTAGTWVVGNNQNGKDTSWSMSSGLDVYIYVIKNPTSGVSDVLLADSLSPTLPSGYTLKRLVGAMVANGSSQFPDFYMDSEGWLTRLDYPTVINGTYGTTATDIALGSVPLGLKNLITLCVTIADNVTTSVKYVTVTDPDVGLTTVNSDLAIRTLSDGNRSSGFLQVNTDTSSQVKLVCSSSNCSVSAGLQSYKIPR